LAVSPRRKSKGRHVARGGQAQDWTAPVADPRHGRHRVQSIGVAGRKSATKVAAAGALFLLPAAVVVQAVGGFAGQAPHTDLATQLQAQANRAAAESVPNGLAVEPGRSYAGEDSNAQLNAEIVADAGDPAKLADGVGSMASLPSGPLGIPGPALDAYLRAQKVLATTDPGCHLSWSLLASIGRIESNHARGGNVDASGRTSNPILGPVLNGNGFAGIRDTDGGRWDGDTVWDRAVGPMQFIPSTWARWAADGNGDGITDPNNIYDATIGAGRYLCSGRDLADPGQRAAAVFSYNHSDSYVRTVLIWADSYAKGVTPLAVTPLPGNPPPAPGSVAAGNVHGVTGPGNTVVGPAPSASLPPVSVSDGSPTPSLTPVTPAPSGTTTPPSGTTPTGPSSGSTTPGAVHRQRGHATGRLGTDLGPAGSRADHDRRPRAGHHRAEADHHGRAPAARHDHDGRPAGQPVLRLQPVRSALTRCDLLR
jgi:membrane-bound lytic murein transglycosylase B